MGTPQKTNTKAAKPSWWDNLSKDNKYGVIFAAAVAAIIITIVAIVMGTSGGSATGIAGGSSDNPISASTSAGSQYLNDVSQVNADVSSDSTVSSRTLGADDNTLQLALKSQTWPPSAQADITQLAFLVYRDAYMFSNGLGNPNDGGAIHQQAATVRTDLGLPASQNGI